MESRMHVFRKEGVKSRNNSLLKGIGVILSQCWLFLNVERIRD